jgi:hypothetical protein
VNGTTRSIDYDLLLREIARLQPRYGFSDTDIKLTNAQAAIAVREFPDVIGEALAGHEAEIAQSMAVIDTAERFDLIAVGCTGTVMRLIRERCTSYILNDLRAMCERIEAEDADENRYEKGACV